MPGINPTDPNVQISQSGLDSDGLAVPVGDPDGINADDKIKATLLTTIRDWIWDAKKNLQDISTDLTNAQKLNVRANLDAMNRDMSDMSRDLTDTMKSTVRDNIGAVDTDDIPGAGDGMELDDDGNFQVKIGSYEPDPLNPPAGYGLQIHGEEKELRVYAGKGLEVSSGVLIVKRDGTSITVGSNGIKVADDFLPDQETGPLHEASDVPAAHATDDTLYAVRRRSTANGGGLDFVEAVFRRWLTTTLDAQRSISWTVPHTGRYRFRLQGGFAGGNGEDVSNCDDGGSASGENGTPGQATSVTPVGQIAADSPGQQLGSDAPAIWTTTYSLTSGEVVGIKVGGGGSGGAGGQCDDGSNEGSDGADGAHGWVRVVRVG